MAGQIRLMIDTLIERRAKGNPTVALMSKTKFVLKGVNPDRYNSMSADDAAVLAKVKAIAAEMVVSV